MIFLKKRITLISILTMLLMGANSEAAEIKSVLLTDFENSVLTVSGEAEEDVINISIFPEGYSLTAGEYEATDLSNVTIQSAETVDGEFSVSFNFPAVSGNYDVYVGTNAVPYKFEFINKTLVLEFVDKLGNGEIPQDDIFNELEKLSASIGVDVSFAKEKSAQDALAENMIYYSLDIKAGGIESIKAIANQTKSEIEFLQKLSETQTATSVNKQLTDFSVSAKIDMTAYNELSDYDKNSICKIYMGKEYENIHTFRTDFAKDIIIAAETDDPKPQSGGSSGGGSSNKGSSSNKGGSINPYTAVPVLPNTPPDGLRLFEKFNDLDDVSWAWDAILYLSDEGIINGVGDGSFSPNSNIKREQIAKIITVAFNKYENGLTSDFDDLQNDGWSEAYIASAKKYGLMMGESDTIFGYGKAVTREDLCVIIYRAAKMSGMTFETEKNDFTDYEEISEYAREAVSYLAGSGIVSGTGDGSFAPKRYATRAEAAKILYAVIGGTK